VSYVQNVFGSLSNVDRIKVNRTYTQIYCLGFRMNVLNGLMR